MITFTKEQLIASAHARIEFAEMMLAGELEPLKERTWSIELELARIALASLEAEPVAYMYKDNLHADARFSLHTRFGNWSQEDINEYEITEIPLYTAPPAPVSVPDAIHSQGEKSASDDYYELGWNACRAAMLQGADRPQNEPQNIPENIPATQFKPVADLYGLTSPTGGETSFTFDAVEARDFIDGGWSCQEYVELGRFQEAMLQNGNSPAQSDCCPEQNYIAPAQDGNSPVIPDGWVMVPVEPTEGMIVNGFESEPDESFSDEKEWEAYDAMSGCQQAAHRAKLCWSAMIAAAPKPEVK